MIKNLKIAGAFLISPDRREDLRGYFEKTFDAKAFKEHGMVVEIKEQFHTVSHKNVIRGMHFQSPPNECAKYVTVTKGEILDVILDLRVDSSTFGEYLTIPLSAVNGHVLYIPFGCAHGFISLQDETCTRYLQTQSFAGESDHGVRFNSFGMDWGVKNPIVSERDAGLPDFKTYESPFKT